MVTRSIDNWEQHKKDVFEVIKEDFGEEKAKIFIKYYSNRYDKFNRSLLHYKAAFTFLDDYFHVKNIGTKFFAFVGMGGSGKTTLMKNVFYFLDDSIDMDRINLEFENFIGQIMNFPIRNAMKAIGLDEPDDTFHPQSKQGRLFRSVLGKARQQNLFIGINATDLVDIPPNIYKKLSVIVFLPYAGKAFIFKDDPLKKKFIIQKIRKEYAEKGYKVFYDYIKYSIPVDTYKISPFSESEENKYIEDKAKDYDNTIKRLKNSFTERQDVTKDIYEMRNQLIVKIVNKVGPTKASELIGMSQEGIRKIKKKIETKSHTSSDIL